MAWRHRSFACNASRSRCVTGAAGRRAHRPHTAPFWRLVRGGACQEGLRLTCLGALALANPSDAEPSQAKPAAHARMGRRTAGAVFKAFLPMISTRRCGAATRTRVGVGRAYTMHTDRNWRGARRALQEKLDRAQEHLMHVRTSSPPPHLHQDLPWPWLRPAPLQRAQRTR